VIDYGHELQFGIFSMPSAEQPGRAIAAAKLADVVGLDLVTFQDHPYQARFLDTWTLLSYLAAETETVRLAPNVANLPLRPPAVLARSVASLDVLSGGRIELGLGAGAFWDGIAAMGGERLTPGESVDALSEAVDVIRSIWDTSTRSARVDGAHHRLAGTHPGPAPAHDVEIWLGAYKPRMLRLTGAKADGWVPSVGYAAIGDLGEMCAVIDDGAERAGRRPGAIRRMLNVGSVGGDTFPAGEVSSWPEQLAELALETGISAFILAADEESAIRSWAVETAPRTRELITAERSRPSAGRAAASAVTVGDAEVTEPRRGLDVTPTPDDGVRLSSAEPWDESERPRGPGPDPGRDYSADEQAAGRHLIDVHDMLRAELDRLRDLIEQVDQGTTSAAAVRSHLNRMAIRQNNWTLGTFCETYCGNVARHHTLEDRSVFPHLRRSDERLAAVLDRLGEEHEAIAEILERVDEALIDLVSSEPEGMEELRSAVDLLTDAMSSHFSYEEHELTEPLARLGFY
jgi:alkanesulfonate monooxygenase SsuD/methylene tetrahydromethanopterin reductase-like flavin-dependent oxidoreductase (luciferase family)/hemerythrin-like domain-containing protein